LQKWIFQNPQTRSIPRELRKSVGPKGGSPMVSLLSLLLLGVSQEKKKKKKKKKKKNKKKKKQKKKYKMV